jgi:hypothetical protein
MADADISSKSPSTAFFDSADDINPILAKFPGPVSISPNSFAWSDRTRLVGGLGCAVVLAIPGVLLIIKAIAIASWGWGLFALVELMFCLALFTAVSVRNGRPRFLVLDQDGFKVRNGRIYQSCRWVDVEGFRLGGILRYPRIRFKNASPLARGRVVLGLGEDWLKFLLPPRDAALASLMNRWRERALPPR